MRILLWHGYLLGGTGSKVDTRQPAREWLPVICRCALLSQGGGTATETSARRGSSQRLRQSEASRIVAGPSRQSVQGGAATFPASVGGHTTVFAPLAGVARIKARKQKGTG